MKIEEVIEHSRYVTKRIREDEDRILCVDDLNAHNCQDCLECAKEYEQLAEWLEELKWYRRQDLIKREDVLNCRPEWLNENMEDAIKSTHNKGWNECNLEWYDAIKQIPNAEPPIGECTPNCEKSITCKHCIQGTFCNSSTGKEEESPCCWESKEEGW